MPKAFWDGKECTWDQDKKIRFDTYIDHWDDVIVPRAKAAGFEYEPNEGIWDVGTWDDGHWDYAQIALFSTLVQQLGQIVFPSFDEIKNRLVDSYPHQTFDDIKDLFLKHIEVQFEKAVWDSTSWDKCAWDMAALDMFTRVKNQLAAVTVSTLFDDLKVRLEQMGEIY